MVACDTPHAHMIHYLAMVGDLPRMWRLFDFRPLNHELPHVSRNDSGLAWSMNGGVGGVFLPFSVRVYSQTHSC